MTKKENKEVKLQDLTLEQKLINIQAELRAKKNRRNDYGGFNYRSAEDILEAVKPICQKYGVLLTLNDEVEYSNEWHYVKATALLTDIGSPNRIGVSAYAREAETKKGMDAMQITGSASSYARKYAMNGLFCIDDAKDADDPATVTREQLVDYYTKARWKLNKLGIDYREDETVVNKILKDANVKSQELNDLNDTQLKRLIKVYVKMAEDKK